MYIGRKGEGGMTDRGGKIFATAEFSCRGLSWIESDFLKTRSEILDSSILGYRLFASVSIVFTVCSLINF